MADSTPATTLESTIADVGALLVQLHKFRAGIGRHAELQSAALAIGDRARRRLHRQSLDADADQGLLAEVMVVRTRLDETLAAIRASDDFRAAVEAHRTEDHPALARLLPRVFDDLELVARPPTLWHALPWLRRSRPRLATDLADVVIRLAADGLEPDADPSAPGLDPELPAVPLDAMPTGGEPLLLRYDPSVLPPAVFRLRTSGALLVHVQRLHAPFVPVVLDALDDEELGEISVDYPRYRAELRRALTATGWSVAGG